MKHKRFNDDQESRCDRSEFCPVIIMKCIHDEKTYPNELGLKAEPIAYSQSKY